MMYLHEPIKLLSLTRSPILELKLSFDTALSRHHSDIYRVQPELRLNFVTLTFLDHHLLPIYTLATHNIHIDPCLLFRYFQLHIDRFVHVWIFHFNFVKACYVVVLELRSSESLDCLRRVILKAVKACMRYNLRGRCAQ
jgi:hypothetical protein